MKYIFAFLIACTIIGYAVSAEAADTANATKFDVRTLGASTDEVTKNVLFSFQPTDVVNAQNIAYWKVRSYCGLGMELSVNKAKEDHCGKAVTLPVTLSNSFSLLYNNNSSQMKNFSFKLKAYDKNGKWLHTVKRSFRW
jgi:hypothetical protein